MALRQLVEGDCGGVNPLMQLGGQFTHDAALKDEGFAQAQFERNIRTDQQMVNEFLGQVAGPPQSFQMQTLLQEMREIEKTNVNIPQLQAAPRIIDEVTGQWTKDFVQHEYALQPLANMQMLHMQPQQQQITHVNEFFEDAPGVSGLSLMRPTDQRYFQPMSYEAFNSPYPAHNLMSEGALTHQFFEKGATGQSTSEQQQTGEAMEDWINDYQQTKEEFEHTASNYNEKFWQRLHDEWQKLSEESEHPWLTEFHDSFDPYKEYQFAEGNPMAEVKNAFEKGKEYIAKGDIPSAVLCFEVATKQDPDNYEVWEHLGISQAENEMDPQSIAALKRSLELKPENPRVLMALAVCYTNESLQSHAVKMLTSWLQANPKYKHLVAQNPDLQAEGGAMASSIIRGNKLLETQNLFLEAVRLNPHEIDPDVQEALGVLYNLSLEYDKAVDCFRAALHVSPQNAKVWNRLGASLANGKRSVEAVEAYQHALHLEPGFIRVRYNVGVCCMNLKAYPQAVEHLLTALNMQVHSAAFRDFPGDVGTTIIKGQQQMSESMWTTLKMVVSLMGRSDLQGYVADRNLEALNEAFKD